MYITCTVTFQAKKDGHGTLKSVTKFGLEDLFHHFFEKDKYPGIVHVYNDYCAYYITLYTYPAHRALADVEAMQKILVKTDLVDLLSTLPLRSPAQQLGAWVTQKTTHHRVTQILSSLGKRVTNAQAKRLNELRLTFEALQDLRSSSKDTEEFTKTLLDKGVRSKPLRDKLSDIVKPKS